jgi:Tol biopolymer transport system component
MKPCIVILATAALCAALILAPAPGLGQETSLSARGKAIKAKRLAENFKRNAGQLTIFDRQGKVVTTVGERDLFNVPFLSPDGKRIAVVKQNPEKETADLWVYDVATGKATQITFGQSTERTQSPVWSPDGSQLAFVALRAGSFGIYRKASDGRGSEELLYKLPGVGAISDWSTDDRYLTYAVSDLSGGTVFALPLAATAGERKPIELFHIGFELEGGGISPDNSFVAYASNESGRFEIYVRAFDPATPKSEGKWQLSTEGGTFPYWRRDGKELYYIAPDRSVMSVEVRVGGTLEFGKPKLVFRPPEATPGPTNFSRDGERIVIAIPPNQLRQIAVFDRRGKQLKVVGEPGFYRDAHLSPDGKRVALTRTDPHTGNLDIWTIDLATGKGTAITNDLPSDYDAVWSADGTKLVFVSYRDNGRNTGIYRRASDGSGNDELLFKSTPGAGTEGLDWSPDGKFLALATGALLLVQLSTAQPASERKAIDWLRDENEAYGGKFSPDMRVMSYESNPEDVNIFNIFVRTFEASKPEMPLGKPVQVSTKGVRSGVIYWSKNSKELCYLTTDWEIECAEITTTPTLKAGTPKVWFKLPGPPWPGDPETWLSSRDGKQFVFVMPATGK